MESGRRVSGFVSLFSALSALSLIAFGTVSLLVVLFSWSWSGAFISLALIAHGVSEWRLRGKLLSAPRFATSKKLAWNQLGLAGSVAVYLSWQLFGFDWSELDAMLSRDPIRGLLQETPGLAEALSHDLPKLVIGFYSVSGVLVLLGCIGMAAMYVKAVKADR